MKAGTIIIFIIGPMLLSGCTTAKNVAANFVPKGKQDLEIADIKSGVYTLDPEHANLQFSFNHMGFSTTRVRFDALDGKLDFDRENPGEATLEITVHLDSVNSRVPDFDEILRGKEFFNVAENPVAEFTSDAVYFTSQTTAEVPGELTLNGITAPVVFEITLEGAGSNWVSGHYTLGFSGEATVNRSTFDLKNLMALTGDEVTITFDAEFQRRD